MKLQVYLDMDGVIVDFVGGVLDSLKLSRARVKNFPQGKWDFDDSVYQKVFGVNNEDIFWGRLTDEFWENLPVTHEFDLYWEYIISKYNPILMSAPPRVGATGKIKWIRKNLPSIYRSGRFCLTRRKELFAQPNTVLIDDRDRNITNFKAAGGEGVLVPRQWNSLHMYQDLSFCQVLWTLELLLRRMEGSECVTE